MTRKDFDFSKGRVTFWDLDLADDLPLSVQIDSLKEDLAQVRFDRLLIDVGWYPSFSLDGEFVVFVIRDRDWECPIGNWTAKSIVTLKEAIVAAIDFVNNQPEL